MEKDIFSLGWELEASSGPLRIPPYVQEGSDGSVSGEAREYRLFNSVVKFPTEGLNQLRLLTADPRLRSDSSCGYHVHLGLNLKGDVAQSLPRLWAAWCITLGKEIEDYAFEAVPNSRAISTYCKKWRGISLPQGIIGQRYSCNKSRNVHRYQWLNITEMFREGGIRTVEFRLMGECHEFAYLLAWTLFCMGLSLAALRLLEDPSRLDYEALEAQEALGKIKQFKSGALSNSSKISVCHYLVNQYADFDPLKLMKSEVFSEYVLSGPPKDAPALNPNISDLVLKAQNHELSNSQIPRSFVSRCHCNSCNIIRWERKKEAKINAVAATETPPPIDRSYDPSPVLADEIESPF